MPENKNYVVRASSVTVISASNPEEAAYKFRTDPDVEILQLVQVIEADDADTEMMQNQKETIVNKETEHIVEDLLHRIYHSDTAIPMGPPKNERIN